jgi:hypothetical protein
VVRRFKPHVTILFLRHPAACLASLSQRTSGGKSGSPEIKVNIVTYTDSMFSKHMSVFFFWLVQVHPVFTNTILYVLTVHMNKNMKLYVLILFSCSFCFFLSLLHFSDESSG